MMKRILSLFALLVLFASISQAQWTNQGPWPDGKISDLHGIAVDPDGKVWAAPYTFTVDSLVGPPTRYLKPIFVYNPDGTEASFSPIKFLTIGGVVDTLRYSCRGMNADAEGNILFVDGFWSMYKINYKTGEGMLKLAGDLPWSPTAPVSDAAGNIYVGAVLGGNPVQIYDKDFNFIQNAVDVIPDYGRTLAVSSDGNTLYIPRFGKKLTYVYQRADEFSAYDSVGVIFDGGMTESMTWHPITKNLWASCGSYFDKPTKPPYTPNSWYGLNLTSGVLTDSFYLAPSTATPENERPRGIAFSPDGMTAYVGTFGGSGMPFISKFTKGGGAAIPVTFQVDLSVQEALGNFTPGTDQVVVRGSFQIDAGDAADWAGTMFTCTDPNADKIYTVTANLPDAKAGTAYAFKFVIIKGGTDNWEGISDRPFTLTGPTQTLDVVFFNNVDKVGKEIDVTFSANMEYEIVSGRFNTATDTMTVRGSFNGWSGTDLMSPNPTSPNFYEITKKYTVAAGETWNYKYAWIYGAGGVNWEGDPNKTYTFTQDDLNAGSAFIERTYNDNTPETITNFPVTVKFQVDVTNAVSSVTGNAFTSVDNVFIAGAVPPLKWPGGGWPDADLALVHFLYDDATHGDKVAGDKIWTVDLVFPQYSPLRIQYKYGANWGLPSNTGANDNESSVGTDHFINLTPQLTTAEVLNIWSTMGDTPLGVEKLPELPVKYELAQNYPNPFNPNTTIKFSVLESGMVTLKVYNSLGQEVATLLNEVKSAGVYETNFDASKLTSGTYIYKITTPQFSSTRKMMLVK
ncbi:MAG: T9SS type A sorting domain-containing protein [Ignavibacteriales bacterium]|nr:T9SS type A sorting domain-containing protein [Ignavibacteriales bacterium]